MIKSKLSLATLTLSTVALSYADKPQKLDTIQVTSKGLSSDIYNQTTDIQVINVDSSYDHYSTVAEIISKASGVQVTQKGGVAKDTNVQIDGISLKNTLVLINGEQIGSATLGQASLSTVLVSQVDRIEIIKGSASSMYGSSAIGGAINIITKQDQNAVSISSGSFGTRKASVSLANNNSLISSGLTLSHFKTDGINARNGANSDSDLDGSENTTINGKVALSLSSNINLYNNLYYSQGSNEYDNKYGGDDQSAFKNAVASSKIEFNSSNFNLIGTYSQYIDSSKNFGVTNSKEEADEFVTRSQKINLSSQYGAENFDLYLGADWKQDDIGDSKLTGNYAKTSIENSSLNSQFSMQQGISLFSLGARIDDHSSFGSNDTYNASVALASSGNKILVSYETGFKAPTFNDLYYPTSPYGAGNPDVQPEESKQVSAILSHSSNSRQLQLKLFRTDFDNLIAWQTTDGFSTPSNIASSRIKGWRFSYTEHLSDSLSSYLSTSRVLTKNKDTGKPLDLTAEYSLKANLTYTLLKHAANIGWEYTGDRASKGVELTNYHLINLGYSLKQFYNGTLSLTVNNVFDKDYQPEDGYNALGTNLSLSFNGTF